MSTTQVPVEYDFNHLRLEDVDDSFKPVETGVYTLEVNKFDVKRTTVKKEGSKMYGQELLVLKGSFTIVDDETNNLRKLWHDFVVNFKSHQGHLKRLMNATAVTQAMGDTLEEWSAEFAKLNPPARFQVLVEKKVDPSDNTPYNEINFYQAKPAA